MAQKPSIPKGTRDFSPVEVSKRSYFFCVLQNIFCSIIFFISIDLNSQNYEFDTFLRYSNISEHGTFDVLNYSNSKDTSYYLSTISTNPNNAILVDYKNKKKHFFKISKSGEKDSSSPIFIYNQTTELLIMNNDVFSDYICDFEYIDTASNVKRINLNIYKNHKKKRPILIYELELKENDKNLFSAFRKCCLHPFENKEDFNVLKNFLVISLKGKTLTKQDIEFKLLNKEEVYFIVNAPE